MKFYYLLSLLISIAGLFFIDHRYKIRPPKSFIYVLAAICFFLCWDIAGIMTGVFSTNQKWVSGIHFVSTNLPLEEVGFLFLLSYLTLLLWRTVCLRIR